MKDLLDLLEVLHVMPLSDDVASIASSPFPVNLRALEFWTHDDRQANAARTRGLEVRGV